MSLLSGIRYLSREERDHKEPQPKSKHNKSSKEKRRDHKSKKRGHDYPHGDRDMSLDDDREFMHSLAELHEKKDKETSEYTEKRHRTNEKIIVGHKTEPDDSAVDTNTNAAALLRARLKIKSVTQPITRSQEPHQTDISFITSGEMKWLAAYTQSKSPHQEASANEGNTELSIADLVAQERLGGGGISDIDSVIASNIIRKGEKFTGQELGMGSLSRGGVGVGGDRAGMDEGDEAGEGELDMRILNRKDEKLSNEDIAKKILAKAQATGKAYAQIVEGCGRCRASRFYRPHRVISTGRYMVLCIKQGTYSIPFPLVYVSRPSPLSHTPLPEWL